MANSINAGQQQQNFQTLFNQFRQNPLAFFQQRNINIPQQFQNDPKGMVQDMLNKGQMTQEQLDKMMQMAQQMGITLS